jgi:hypothetical protein
MNYVPIDQLRYAATIRARIEVGNETLYCEDCVSEGA